MIRIYVYAAVVAIALAILASASYKGYKLGEASCEAKHAHTAIKADTEIQRREVASSAASITMLDYLAANLPPIEATKNDSVERIRTIYRDVPVPGVCQFPPRVRDELNQARARANAAGKL